jgi:25S rRNA (adenine2142-N1)-methyltransferase
MAVKKRPKTLSHGRPPISRPKERMSAQQSRTIIRTHHRLQKDHAAALKRGDTKAAEDLEKAIEKNGGITTYQAASKQGQAKDRGGDSSKVLVDWLRQANVIDIKTRSQKSIGNVALRCLEVGALSTTNEISKFPSVVEMTRIDLNSQGSGIEKQDFMERPLPTSRDECFDILSLSLVLNYVPDAVGRGKMLRRVTQFLRRRTSDGAETNEALPLLFLVLPLPCIDNSRYFDEPRLLEMMKSFGFTLMNKKLTPKLCYHLFSLEGEDTRTRFEKKKIRDKPGMNNFCIIVE